MPLLITGASGCIGSSTVRHLIAEGHTPIAFSRSAGAPEGIESIHGDVTDPASISDAIEKVRPTQIIHLAGFQTPDCQAQPFAGLDVNALGTNHLLRAAANLGSHLERFVFASSAAVYGPRAIYPGPTVTPEDPVFPPNLYGFWKFAGEGMCQAFHMETNIPTISLRLATTYGPGRDRGLTSAPTTALKAAALGTSFEIPYNGREHYHYVDDVGAAFSISATSPYQGYGVFNLRGQTLETREFCDRIAQTATAMGLPSPKIKISSQATAMPFVCDLDSSSIERVFATMPLTPIDDGIHNSLSYFHDLKTAGTLTKL